MVLEQNRSEAQVSIRVQPDAENLVRVDIRSGFGEGPESRAMWKLSRSRRHVTVWIREWLSRCRIVAYVETGHREFPTPWHLAQRACYVNLTASGSNFRIPDEL
jgi:hypothetical protein